jgi:hypothetical protein
MTAEIKTTLLEAFSRGEITRKEIEEQTGEAVSFGTIIRVPGNPQSPGVQLIKRLAERGPRAE